MLLISKHISMFFFILKLNNLISNDYCLFRENRDEYIKNTMRDNMQLLVNALWQVS